MENIYKLVSYFRMDDKEYFIIKVNNRIVFVVKDIYGISFRLNKKDSVLFNKVFDSILVDEKNSINLGTKEYNGNKFNIFYDSKKRMHFWHPIDSKLEPEDEEESNTFFNFKYNYLSNYLYSEKENKKEHNGKYIKRLINFGKKVIVVLVSAGLSITALTGCTIEKTDKADFAPIETVSFLEDELGEEYKDLSLEQIDDKKRAERPYNFEEIKQSIEDNKNLTDEEKDFFYKLKFIFDENHEYMDIDTIIERFRNLRITYSIDEDETAYGRYRINQNEIIIYNSTGFSYDKIEIILHEILHVMQVYEGYSNRLSLELSNEIASREFLRRMNDMGLIPDSTIFENELKVCTDFAGGYQEVINAQYLLNELLTPEQIKQYQFNPREDIIIRELKAIDNSSSHPGTDLEVEQRAYKLLDAIDEFRTFDESGDFKLNFENDDYYNLYHQMDYYYQILNDKSIEESMGVDLFSWEYWSLTPIMSNAKIIAFDETMEKLMLEKMEDRRYIFGGKRFFLPKSYFSNDYKYPIIVFNSLGINENVTAVEIDEELEEKYLKNLIAYKERKMSDSDLEK